MLDARRAAADSVVRRSLLDIASELLSNEGPAGLSMRRIAAAGGCSTTVLYSTFGSKEGIADALFAEGFRRFAERLAAVPADDDPLRRLVALRDAYRLNALANPHYYRVMFGQLVPGFAPSPAASEQAAGTLQVLCDQVQACMDAGVFAVGDAAAVAEALWAAAHGVVSLELSGHLDPAVAAERFATVTDAVGAAFLRSDEEE